MINNEEKLAVLIDADNVADKMFDKLFSEIAKLGEITVKRIYGDFTSSSNARWKEILNKYAIRPISQFAYTTGKNATDGSLIIDAMDLLHTHRFDGFCIISSDSDFTGLAMRIKEEGLKVYGFGEKKTPEAFQNACNKFTFFELLENVNSASPNTDNSTVAKKTKSDAPKNNPVNDSAPPIPYNLIKMAIRNSCDDSGVARLGTVGQNLIRLKPDFNARLYSKKAAALSTILRARPDLFEISGCQGTLCVKIKK